MRTYSLILSIVLLSAPMASAAVVTAAPGNGSLAMADGLGGILSLHWRVITPQDLSEKIKQKEEHKAALFVVDIRNEFDFQKGAIEGAVNVPRKKLRFLAEKLFQKTDPIVIYGYSLDDKAAVNSVIFLINKGYQQVMFLEGGWKAWQKEKEML